MNPLGLFADSPLIYRLGSGLVHFLWEGLVIAAALAVVLRLLGGRPAARHAAAWLALIVMAAAVPLTAWLVAPSAPAVDGSPLATLPPPDAAGEDAPVVASPDGERPAPSSETAPPAPASLQPVAGGPAPPEVAAVLVSTPIDLRGAVHSLAPWAVSAWLAGAALLTAWRFGGWLFLRRLCGRGARPAAAEVQAVLDRLLERLNVRRAVRLLESARVDVPAVVGWLRPVILLPAGILTGLSPQQLELILAHELAHIRRHDFLANLVQTAVETVLFYHPAVWWVSRQIRIEREACCDDVVVAATGERLLYARALARLEQLRAEAPSRGLAGLSVGAGDGDLLARIRRVLGLPREARRRSVPQLAASAAVLVLAAGLSAYVAAGGEPVADEPRPQQEPGKAAPRDDRPRVVQVVPADGATNVPPVTDIRIRFDRPMDATAAALAWTGRNQAGFRPRGELRYDAAAREFILPVELTPGQKHDLMANQEGISHGTETSYEGFQSEGGLAAPPFRWSFTTAAPAARAGVAPRVTAVNPPSDTEVALVTPLEVTFDRPMDPSAYGLGAPDESSSDRRPTLLGRPDYDVRRQRFTLLVQLPPNWNGELRLEGFRGQDGAAAPLVDLKYRTLRQVVSEAHQRHVEQAGRSVELRQLVERVRQARRELTSVAEEAVWATWSGYNSPDWSQNYKTHGTRFQMQGDRKFVGVVDGIMGIPFRVGSDGTTCWLRARDERTALPATDVEEKHLLFCDPFRAGSAADAARVIQDLKLEYLGETTVRGRRCHRVRSWDFGLVTSHWLSPVREWFFDAATLLPVRVAMLGSGGQTIDYTHTRVNQPIPDEEFRPDAGPNVKEAKPDPLAEGYTRRFLNVIDGSNGRMSVRWGMKGPKGTRSSGLN
jgi:beta-lactamase regulating signal transducer with metallopeptidase domain